jgi:hypothetical protein
MCGSTSSMVKMFSNMVLLHKKKPLRNEAAWA